MSGFRGELGRDDRTPLLTWQQKDQLSYTLVAFTVILGLISFQTRDLPPAVEELDVVSGTVQRFEPRSGDDPPTVTIVRNGVPERHAILGAAKWVGGVTALNPGDSITLRIGPDGLFGEKVWTADVGGQTFIDFEYYARDIRLVRKLLSVLTPLFGIMTYVMIRKWRREVEESAAPRPD